MVFLAIGRHSDSLIISFFFLLKPPPPTSTLFPYTTLFRSEAGRDRAEEIEGQNVYQQGVIAAPRRGEQEAKRVAQPDVQPRDAHALQCRGERFLDDAGIESEGDRGIAVVGRMAHPILQALREHDPEALRDV